MLFYDNYFVNMH